MRHSNRQERQTRREKKVIRERAVSPRAREEVQLARKIEPKTHFQRELLAALVGKDAVFANGPAGTGKTFVVMSTVIDWLKSGEINKIILSRPTVGMGDSLGLLPGGIREKFEPYLAALVDVIVKRYGQGYYETQLSNKNIEFVPWNMSVVVLLRMLW